MTTNPQEPGDAGYTYLPTMMKLTPVGELGAGDLIEVHSDGRRARYLLATRPMGTTGSTIKAVAAYRVNIKTGQANLTGTPITVTLRRDAYELLGRFGYRAVGAIEFEAPPTPGIQTTPGVAAAQATDPEEPRCPTCGEPQRQLDSGAVGHCEDACFPTLTVPVDELHGLYGWRLPVGTAMETLSFVKVRPSGAAQLHIASDHGRVRSAGLTQGPVTVYNPDVYPEGAIFTVQVEAGALKADGERIWQAVAPAELVILPWGTPAEQVAEDTAANQNVADGPIWRVRVWDGTANPGDDITSTLPAAEYVHDETDVVPTQPTRQRHPEEEPDVFDTDDEDDVDLAFRSWATSTGPVDAQGWPVRRYRVEVEWANGDTSTHSTPGTLAIAMKISDYLLTTPDWHPDYQTVAVRVRRIRDGRLMQYRDRAATEELGHIMLTTHPEAMRLALEGFNQLHHRGDEQTGRRDMARAKRYVVYSYDETSRDRDVHGKFNDRAEAEAQCRRIVAGGRWAAHVMTQSEPGAGQVVYHWDQDEAAHAASRRPDPTITWAVWDDATGEQVSAGQDTRAQAEEILATLQDEIEESAGIRVRQTHVHALPDGSTWTAPADDCERCTD